MNFRQLGFASKNKIDAEEIYIFKKLCEYFSFNNLNDESSFLEKEVRTVSISELKRLNSRKIGNVSYSFLLSYRYQKHLQQRYLVLKIYRDSLDPVLKKYVSNENSKRCLTEFQVLKGLDSVNFQAPKAILSETNSNVVGNPFMIMQREEINPTSIFNITSFAKKLATIHRLDINNLGISVLKAPEGKYDFARNSIDYLKMYLNLYPKHSKGLMKDFDFAIRWLESNVSNNSCNKCSLLHGDYRARLNTILTKDGRMLVTDWEDAQIGDPMYDVGVAYVRSQVDFGKKTADKFLQKYVEYLDEDFSEKIDFYKLVAHLRLAITHSSILSAPFRAYEIRGTKALLLFPFLNMSIINRYAGTDLDIIWIENFKKFVEENLRN
jgi:aminoglycoside phosphotransferase (APT) family kinase protein